MRAVRHREVVVLELALAAAAVGRAVPVESAEENESCLTTVRDLR